MKRRGSICFFVLATLVALVTYADAQRRWSALEHDGVHDPDNAALAVLQQPAEALIQLPADTSGNQVDWVSAIEDGYIKPRGDLHGDGERQVLDTDVLMRDTGDAAYVLFPHRSHTLWLSCENCHDAIFVPEIGKNDISMLEILQGRSCGQCHGAVAFPLTECARCHSVKPGQASELMQREGP